jgi:hypothetical protein
MDPATWIIRDPQINARGAKSCQIEKSAPQVGSDAKIRFFLGGRDEPSSTPFGATSWGDEATTRKTIEFNLTPAQEAKFDEITAWAHEHLAKHSERLFRKVMSAEQVADTFRPPVTKKGDFHPHLRCKINVAGAAAVRCWDAAGKSVPLPPDLKSYKLVPRIMLSHLWMMARECGFVMVVTDLQLIEGEGDTCPFS